MSSSLTLLKTCQCSLFTYIYTYMLHIDTEKKHVDIFLFICLSSIVNIEKKESKNVNGTFYWENM